MVVQFWKTIAALLAAILDMIAEKAEHVNNRADLMGLGFNQNFWRTDQIFATSTSTLYRKNTTTSVQHDIAAGPWEQ